MNPQKLTDNNFWVGVDQRGVTPVPATSWRHPDGDPVISTGWQPTADELQLLYQGFPVILDVKGGAMLPVVVRVGQPEDHKAAPVHDSLMNILRAISETTSTAEAQRLARDGMELLGVE